MCFFLSIPTAGIAMNSKVATKVGYKLKSGHIHSSYVINLKNQNHKV